MPNADALRTGTGSGDEDTMSFHVPEDARNRTHPILGSDESYGNNGSFELISPEPGWFLLIIASDGGGWEHVSVHVVDRRDRQRTPNWREMCFVKDQFWDAEDVVMQLHPRRSEYVNYHPHTLHLWRPTGAEIPTPPSLFVGPLVSAR